MSNISLTLKAKGGNVPALNYMSRDKLNAIVASLEIVLDNGVELVFFGTEAPYDTSKRWQKTNTYGTPIGGVQTYNKSKGTWQ